MTQSLRTFTDLAVSMKPFKEQIYATGMAMVKCRSHGRIDRLNLTFGHCMQKRLHSLANNLIAAVFLPEPVQYEPVFHLSAEVYSLNR